MKKIQRVDWSKSPGGVYHTPAVIMTNKTLTDSSARVLSYLMSLWSCCETVNPSVERIAELNRITKRSVQNALEQLTQLGLVTILSRGNGRGRTSEYKLNGSKINEFLGVDLCKVDNDSPVKVSKMTSDDMYQYFIDKNK